MTNTKITPKNLEMSSKKSTNQNNYQNNNSESILDTASGPAQDSSVSTNNAVKHTAQTNVFDFMMNTRHKSIGRNSPGRELDANDVVETIVDKDKSASRSRKAFLARWAEAKGASKRKREYEEVGKCIEHKLKKREKNFKRMLNIGHKDNVTPKRKKVSKVIESDEEEGKT